ncbi:MAG: MBL fold metallo-hydrolase [Pseudomonadota bacterium]
MARVMLGIVSVLLLSVACDTSNEPSSGPIGNNTVDLIVTVLGSGTPIPSPTQFGTAILVEAGEEYLLFDCGRGCTTRLAQLDQALITRVTHLFITHLHSDHIVGVDDLWLNGWTQGRNIPLEIWGPEGIHQMMASMRDAFAFDIHRRHTDGLPATQEGIADAFTELLDDGVVFFRNGVTVTAFKVDHATVKPAWGFRVDYKNRSVMISGDTTVTESLYTYGKGADVILQEVISPLMTTYLKNNFTPKQVAKVLSYHTEAKDAGDVFRESEPRLAVYYHTGTSERSTRPLLAETREVYDGRLEVSHDLFQIRIGDAVTTHNMSIRN